MELTLDVASEICRHCGHRISSPGFSEMLTYTCKKCGKPVRLSDDPDVD
jgi:DNA-directed RNA polymerase subunit RPC12/RpoP